MYTTHDEYSGRPVAEDAQEVLQAFRDSGAVSFHRIAINEVRERYVTATAAAALPKLTGVSETDFQVDQFRVRLYDPRPVEHRDQPTPGIVFIHGGGWLMGDLRTHDSVAHRLAARTGQPLIAVDYRLAPEHRYPAAIDDCRVALRWFAERADLHGIQLSSVSFIGDSAGGQLSATLTNEAVQTGIPRVNSQVLLYPITDISDKNLDNSLSYQRLTTGFPMVADTMRWFIDTYVDKGEVRARPDLSPLLATLPEHLPPSYVITVDNDPLADEGGCYALKLASSGATVRYDHLLGYAHGLFTSAGKIPTGERYLHEAADFISQHSC
ncbi:Carboxylesterase NlhH [Corynebacterium occultum]|uniref:Carboxylesterase NlhH n=1 Tax=Corynebacterium occultum TaxID=2675219 RepID=A0A6B8WBL4_9CORY|nr:alpha/beta hydrolase [Corynebacterium occultum]QGU08236.1 Carboxylesterase NlhH [Corynebacterium occultum]